MNLRIGVCALLLMLLCAPVAEGAVFCATSGNQLNIALRDSTMNGQHDEIRVTVGVHITDFHAPQAYQWEARIAHEDDLDKALNISGGWSTGNNCALQVSQNPSDTVLDARTWGPVLYFDPTNSIPGWSFSGAFSLRNLTFDRGKNFFDGQPTGILINAALASPGSLVIDNVRVVRGQSSHSFAQAVGLGVGGSGSVKFRNSIVSNNTFTGPTSWPVGIFPSGNVFGMVTNNSIYGNSVTHIVAGLIVVNTATLTNNAVADNVSTAIPNYYQFFSDNPTNLTLKNNHFETKAFANGAPYSETDTTTGNPAWALVGVRMVPNLVSPLRDSGKNDPLGEVPNIDFSGQPRIVNLTIDRGAVEADAPPAAEIGPLVTAASPANGSTTVFQGPIGGGFVGTQLTFNVSGGVAPGVTELECSKTPDSSPLFGINSNGDTVAVGEPMPPITVGFDYITSEQQTGSVTCVVTRELAGTSYLTYNFVAVPPGGPAIFDSSPKKSPNPASTIDLTDPYAAEVGTDLLGRTLTILNVADFGDSDMQVFCGLSGGSDPQITASPAEFNGDLISPQGALEVTFDCDTKTAGNFFADYSCNYDLDQTQNPLTTDGTAQYRVECFVRSQSKDARFRVTKEFTDGQNPTEVDVTITCNDGLPIKATQTISETRDVVFVVSSFDPGEMDCSITEDTSAPGSVGYTPTYTAVGPGNPDNVDGCNFHAIYGGTEFTCDIVNDVNPVTVEVCKDWIIDGSGGDEVSQHYELTLYCDNEILGGYNYDANLWWLDFAGSTGDSSDCGKANSEHTAAVIPHWDGGTDCYVREDLDIDDDAVESDISDCDDLHVNIGGLDVGSGDNLVENVDSCTVTNTVFFEGIPTISHRGMAILALLMLGVGLIGFRRFV